MNNEKEGPGSFHKGLPCGEVIYGGNEKDGIEESTCCF